MIDWSKPVETDEDEPREFIVFSTERVGGFAIVAMEKGGGGKSDGKPGVFDTGGEYAAFNHPGCRKNLRNVKPKRIKIPGGWRNVYGPRDWSELHISRGVADCEAVPTRIACIYVEDREFEVGEGLEPAEEVEHDVVTYVCSSCDAPSCLLMVTKGDGEPPGVCIYPRGRGSKWTELS